MTMFRQPGESRESQTLLSKNQTPSDFVEANTKKDCLRDCQCKACFKRARPGNVRDLVDSLVVNAFDHLDWSKDKPIQLLDVSAGNLRQVATIVTSLVNAGYKVGISIVDAEYWNWEQVFQLVKQHERGEKIKDPRYEKAIIGYSDDEAYRQVLAAIAIDEFKRFLVVLNEKTGKVDAAVLNGIFSHVDSYLATLKGNEPLKYLRLPQEEIRRRVASGEKRRYLNSDHITNPYTEVRANQSFNHEFKQAENCRGKLPDLVLAIDDISEFFPIGIKGLDHFNVEFTGLDEEKRYRENKDNDFAYENEVIEPIKQLNVDAVFIGTKTMIPNFVAASQNEFEEKSLAPTNGVEIHIVTRNGKKVLVNEPQTGTAKDKIATVMDSLFPGMASGHSLKK
jgi:hypothetical protein